MSYLQEDLKRYAKSGDMPKFAKYFRKAQETRNPLMRYFFRFCFAQAKKKNHIDLFYQTKIGGGLYIGHPYGITINADVVIGRNCNIHKGVTIGQENRGRRKGCPTIGDNVWIGINSTIVGKINIGEDVLVAPNTYVNCDVPEHSIVFGNPCIIKHKDNATEGYISRKSDADVD